MNMHEPVLQLGQLTHAELWRRDGVGAGQNQRKSPTEMAAAVHAPVRFGLNIDTPMLRGQRESDWRSPGPFPTETEHCAS